jgi:hypothetical protein
MTIQNYYLVNTADNICDNVVLWDGDDEGWMPPISHLALIAIETVAKVWALDPDINDYVLVDDLAAGGIGFTWDGNYLITNQPKPPAP